MKRIPRAPLIAALLIVVLSTAGCPASAGGPKPVDATTAEFRTIGSVKLTVDTLMRAWTLHVATVGRCPTAKTKDPCAPADQEARVRDAFQKYKDTAHALGVVLVATGPDPAPQQLADAAAAIVNLVQSFLGHTVPIPAKVSELRLWSRYFGYDPNVVCVYDDAGTLNCRREIDLSMNGEIVHAYEGGVH